MATNSMAENASQVREVINRLQAPIPDLESLLALIAAPLDCLNLLPPQYRSYNISPISSEALHATRHLPSLQRSILEHVIPSWYPTLLEKQLIPLLDQYFIPDSFSYATPSAGQIVLHGYSTLLSLPFTPYSLNILARLSKAYPIDRLHSAIFSTPGPQSEVAWEDTVKNVLSVPPKVANALAGKGDIPPELEQGAYYVNVCLRSEVLVNTLAQNGRKGSIPSVTYLFTRLVNVGALPPWPPNNPSQSSFFASARPKILARLFNGTGAASYSDFWTELLGSLPSSLTVQSIVMSLFGHTMRVESVLDPSPSTRTLVKREAELLRGILGPLNAENELWDNIIAIILGREWPEEYARVFVCWAAISQSDEALDEGLIALLQKTVDVWSSSEHIKHSLLSRHHYMTLLLLNTVSHFPNNSPTLTELAFQSSFIRSVGTYIGHLDDSVRRCGMLVAEEIARRTDKNLDFGDWDGDESGKAWARRVRMLIKERDADIKPLDDESEETTELKVEDLINEDFIESLPERKETASLSAADAYDSDDSLTGYVSPSSSRSPSPTPSELDEYEKDPTVRLGGDKIRRPVYLAQLGELIRPSGMKTEQENQEADKVEMGLNTAEELIRRKRNFGTELQENAVNLVYGLLGLNNNYEIDGFDHKRQGALNALVACCPRRAAPSIIAEFFKNQYSTDQRYVMLNALALGARELAGLPLPDSAAVRPLVTDKISFPSKRLPPLLHDRYSRSEATFQVQGLLTSISRQSIENTKDATEQKAPELVRERRLRVRQPAKVAEIQRASTSQITRDIRHSTLQQSQMATFTEVAVEYFVYPLISRFWLFLKDEQTREDRTAHRDTLHRYHGAGTGLILNTIVLSHFLATLAVLVHAARNVPEWLAVVAPDALELAVTLGTRPVTSSPDEDDDSDDDEVSLGAPRHSGREEKEARVLTTALELALIVLDGCAELDGGRSLGLDHTALLLDTGEWAGHVFSRLEKGLLVKGGGGMAEVRLSKAAAGVVLKANELAEKWKRSMIDLAR